MQSGLIPDVCRLVLARYASEYAPLWQLACTKWKNQKVVVAVNPTASRDDADDDGVRGLQALARDGQTDLLQWLHGRRRVQGQKDWTEDTTNVLMRTAAKYGHDKLVHRCRLWGATDVAGAMAAAAYGGHETLVRALFHEKIAPPERRTNPDDVGHDWPLRDVVNTISYAACGGHTSIVQMGHDEWHLDVEEPMAYAAGNGHEHLVRYCHDVLGGRNVNGAMIQAAREGYIGIVRLCREEWKATDVDGAMVAAAEGGQMDILRLCHDHYHATDINAAMVAAAEGGHMDILRLCHDHYHATNVNQTMVAAAWWGHEQIVRICHDEWGATTNVVGARRAADRHGHTNIVRMCDRWIKQKHL